MNERIRELAEQAQQYAEYVTPQGLEWFNAFKEKFAELIVKECVSVVENISPGYDDYRNQIEDAFRRDCVFELKKTFGAE